MTRYFIDKHGRKFKRVNGTLFMEKYYALNYRHTFTVWGFSNYTGELEEV